MHFVPTDLLYEGKGKKVFCIQGHKDKVYLEFKNDLTAFNAQKTSSFEGKGKLTRDITSLLFRYLKNKGHSVHWIEDHGEHSMIVHKINMIPLEVVVRNRLAGFTAKRFQIKDGTPLDQPLFELYYKKDELGDPFISKEQALMLGACSGGKDIEEIQLRALAINQDLLEIFQNADMDLIDFKLEFGKNADQQLVLGDEISADSCRIWEKKTGDRLDKDRFRLDLGNVKQGYHQIYSNLVKAWQE